MLETENYQFPLYEGNDAANLLDGYNASMRTLDSLLKQMSDVSDKISNLVDTKAPINHAVSTGTYGLATGALYGHVMLSDRIDYSSNKGNGVAATPEAVRLAYEKANSGITDASSAKSTANSALATANTANSTAEKAQTTATSAQSTANSTQSNLSSLQSNLKKITAASENITSWVNIGTSTDAGVTGTTVVNVFHIPAVSATIVSISAAALQGDAFKNCTYTLRYKLPAQYRPTREIQIPLAVLSTSIIASMKASIHTDGSIILNLQNSGEAALGGSGLQGSGIFFGA